MPDDLLIQPSFVPNPKVLPSPDAPQNPNIRPGSRLAILGVFVEFLRLRFTAGTVDPSFQWLWNRDPNKATIEIESAFNEDKSQKNKRPAIYVDIDEQVNGRTVLGDMAAKNLQTGLTGFFHLRTLPIIIECVASKRAESADLADLVDISLQGSNRLIQAAFGFHDMTPTTCGRTQPAPKDKNEFITPVTFTVQSVLRYTNVPTAPLLEQIVADIGVSGAESATEFFETIALNRASR